MKQSTVKTFGPLAQIVTALTADLLLSLLPSDPELCRLCRCHAVQVLDDKNVRRRFRASNYQSMTRVKPFICTMPMRLDDGWNQIQFNLSDFTRRAYGTNYIETLRVQVSHDWQQVLDPNPNTITNTTLALPCHVHQLQRHTSTVSSSAANLLPTMHCLAAVSVGASLNSHQQRLFD
jgi:hypothetical protein